MSNEKIRLRLLCIHPPSGAFGLQDKNQDIVIGIRLDDDNLFWSFELMVKKGADAKPNFTGQYAHGRVQERFLYLTSKAQVAADEWRIVRRIKVHLKTIEWQQVEAVLANPDAYLEVQVDGRGSASVPLLGDGWIVKIVSD